MPSLPDRPAVLTDQAQQNIVRLLRDGNYLTVACAASGVDSDTFYYWHTLYESGAEHAQKYADFFGAVKKAGALAEVDALGTVKRCEDGWQGSAWFLERRYPKRWSKRDPAPPPVKDQATDTVKDTVERARSKRRDRGAG